MSNTRVGVSNTRGGVSNTRGGVSNTRVGVFITFSGVSNTRARVREGGAVRRHARAAHLRRLPGAPPVAFLQPYNRIFTTL